MIKNFLNSVPCSRFSWLRRLWYFIKSYDEYVVSGVNLFDIQVFTFTMFGSLRSSFPTLNGNWLSLKSNLSSGFFQNFTYLIIMQWIQLCIFCFYFDFRIRNYDFWTFVVSMFWRNFFSSIYWHYWIVWCNWLNLNLDFVQWYLTL